MENNATPTGSGLEFTQGIYHFKQLADQLPNPIWLSDISKRCIWFNRSWLLFTGRSMEQELGDGWSEGVHQEDLGYCVDTYTSAFDAREPFQMQYRLHHYSGEYRQIVDIGRPIFAPDGVTFLGYIGSVHDITESAKAAEELSKSEETLRFVLEGSGDGFWDWDIPSNRFLFSNRWAEMLGHRPEDLERVSETWEALVHPEDFKRLRHQIDLHFSGISNHIEIELRMLTRVGEWKWVLVRGKLVVRTPSGSPQRMAGTTTDLTERKLLERRMQQAEKMEAIGQLAGGIAHDFNNQLSGIMGFADVLSYAVTDPLHKEYAERIVNTAQRAAELTKQLLAFARKGQYLSVPINVHSLISEVVSILEHTIDKNIIIKQRFEASPATTVGDPNQLQNALLNLAVNARDAMPTGGELLISTRLVELDEDYSKKTAFEITPGQYIHLSVTDTGIGIPEDVLPHIFEPFYTTKEKGRGTGMGLAAVYGSIKNHRGAVSVYSVEGHGTTFNVYLPAVESATLRAQAPSAAMPIQGSARVMVIDDEEIVRLVSSEILSNLGYRVVTFASGAAAIEYFKSHSNEIDLVLIDMIMPEMDGRTVFLAMREIKPNLKTLLTSGYSLNKEAQELLDLGMLDFLQKPFQTIELSQKIHDAILKK